MKLTEEESAKLWEACNQWIDCPQEDAYRLFSNLREIVRSIRAANEPKSIWWCETHKERSATGDSCTDSHDFGRDCRVVEYVQRSV